MSDFDPSGVTVDEVVAYAEDHPDELQDIRDAEADGKGRTTLLSKLDSLIEAQEEDEDEDDEEDEDEEDEGEEQEAAGGEQPDFRSP